ncbi:MAG: TatD family hydrolase [Chitinophagaceae bacterium]
MYINIHTHQTAAAHEWTIQNLYKNFQLITEPGRYSIGLHPWYIDENWLAQMDELKEWCKHSNIIAIGECGLDKICKTDFFLQLEVFGAKVQLANTINKPLIIHCVRAWEEVFQLLEQQKNKVPVIFHGFNKNLLLAQKIISRGYYLSFGKSLQKDVVKRVLTSLPINKIFLETDDKAISILKIYEMAAQAFSVDVNSLVLQMEKNAAIVFGAAAIQL